MRLARLFITVFIIGVLTACGGNYVYNDCQDIDDSGWHIDSPAIFAPQISDTVGRYDILLTIRHTSEYEYQNLWTFIEVSSPDGLTASDTIECYLADNKGHFIGSGISIYEMPVLISRNIQFEKAGRYEFKVIQGMREERIKGIKNICLSLEKR